MIPQADLREQLRTFDNAELIDIRNDRRAALVWRLAAADVLDEREAEAT